MTTHGVQWDMDTYRLPLISMGVVSDWKSKVLFSILDHCRPKETRGIEASSRCFEWG